MRVFAPVIVCLAVAVAGTGPAFGATRGGPATLPPLHLLLPTVKSGRSTHSCQVTGHGGRGIPNSAVLKAARTLPVVACEQPPRSELLSPTSLGRANSNALATIG
jgi:hypothetical protein